MTAQSHGQELSSLREIVVDLERAGWIVETEPSTSSLPPPLHGLRVDLVARRDDEILVGEIASRQSARADKIDLLARRVKLIPNARLEVYWRGDAPEETPPLRDVTAALREVQDVAEVNTSAALLLAWAAFEGAIMRLASDKLDSSRWHSPRQLLTNLYSLGYVSEGDFQRLSDLYRMRSEIAHTLSRARPSREDIKFILDVAERMATGRYISVDQMIEWFLDNYSDPAEKLPYDSAEGGYQYVGDGPHYAADVLSRQFPDAPEDALAEAVRTLEAMSFEWVSKHDS